jgi:hypothetical protein
VKTTNRTYLSLLHSVRTGLSAHTASASYPIGTVARFRRAVKLTVHLHIVSGSRRVELSFPKWFCVLYNCTSWLTRIDSNRGYETIQNSFPTALSALLLAHENVLRGKRHPGGTSCSSTSYKMTPVSWEGRNLHFLSRSVEHTSFFLVQLHFPTADRQGTGCMAEWLGFECRKGQEESVHVFSPFPMVTKSLLRGSSLLSGVACASSCPRTNNWYPRQNYELRFGGSRRWLWRIPTCMMWCRVALIRTDVSEERIASIIREIRIVELGTAVASYCHCSS